jgi:uncharacterized protein (TIGR02099 family)
MRKVGKILLWTVAGCVGLILLLMLGVKIALDRAPKYQAEIKEWVHAQTGYHIRFAHVSPSFRWYGPELYFDTLELRSKDDQRVLARAAGGRVAADIFRLIASGKLLAGRVELDGASISVVRLGETRFAIASEIEIGGNNEGAGFSLDDLPSGTLAIRRATVTVQDWNAQLPKLALQDVNIDIRHEEGASLTFAGQLPAELGGNLTLRTKVSGRGAFKDLSWTALARVRGLSFPGWRAALPEYLAGLTAGVGTFDMNASGVGTSLSGAEVNFAANGVAMQLADGRMGNFDQMSGVLALAHRGERWHLSGRRVRALKRDPESSFDVDWRRGDVGLYALEGRASYVRVETLLPLTGFLPQQDLRERLREIAPTGEWMDTTINLAHAAADAPWRFQVSAKFRDVGFAPLGRVPGLRGLSGSIAGNDVAGHVNLDTRTGTFNWPSQFSQPVDLKALHAGLFWKRSDTELLVASSDVHLKTPDAELHAKFAWLKPQDESSPVLTLVSHIENGNAVNAKNYLPRGFIAPSAMTWLSRAFLSGHLSGADAVFEGPVKRFPFRDGGGLFLVNCTIENMQLDYGAGWPVADITTAHAEFRNEGLTVRGSGMVGEIPVMAMEAQFADFKTGELRIKASAEGDAAAAVDYLRATPLDAMAEHAFSSVEAHGALQASIDLFLPFKEFDHRRILVHGHLDNATLRKIDFAPVATDISGDFDIDGAQVAQADLHGQLLGGPFQLQSRAARNRPVTRTQLEMRGTFTAAAVKKTFELPPSVAISGQSDWRGTLKMAPDPARERSLRLSSTLAGIQLRLPDPLNKAAETPLPSWFEVQWPTGHGPQGSLAVGTLASGSYSLETEAGEYKLTKLALNFGTDEPGKNSGQILEVGGSVERVDLAGWLDLNKPDKNAKPLAYYLRTAKMHVAELDYLGLAFRDVSLDLVVNDGGLRIDVGGPNITGSVAVPGSANGADPWTLQFDKLQFEVAERDTSGDGDTIDAASDAASSQVSGFSDPRGVPALNFHAAQLIWGERRFGDVRAALTKLDDGVRMQSLAVTGPTFNVKATGEWRGKDAGKARIEGTFTSTDVASTLKDLGYADVMQARAGKMDFDLNWIGPPTPSAIANINGDVKLAFEKGQVVGLKPGAGRVLGLTSIATLPRRLALDFSDLTDKGLAFDTVRGDFKLSEGNATTDNVILKGPAAEIGLIGRVGLKNRDYDQTAVVTGNLGNSLPLAALVGGPIVAGAVLVFTQVFKQPLKGLARGYYRITGGWDNPTVERIKGAEAAAATAEAPK